MRNNGLYTHRFRYEVTRTVDVEPHSGGRAAQPQVPATVLWWDEPSDPKSDAELDALTVSKRVLLVDDDPTLRRHGALLLQTLGYQVEVCANGFEALDLVLRSRHRFALLFTNIAMPGMDGRVLAARIQTLQPEMKVLFTSGFSLQLPFALSGQGANVHYLSKPYTVSALAHMVQQILRGSNRLES
jgi:CheY-like chemotaxis protein